MKPRSRTSLMRSTTARLAVACTATLASTLAFAPAMADEVTGDTDTTDSTPTTDESVVEDTTDETPETVVVEDTEDASSKAPAVDNADESGDPVVAAVEPDYGTQKFRVGVKIAEGADVAPGTTTLGSVFKIRFSGSTDADDNDTFECETTTQPDEDGTTYCEVEDTEVPPPPFTARARGDAETVIEDDIPVEQAFIAPPGATVTVSQVSAAPDSGLVKTNKTTTIEPCETGFTEPGFPVCGELDFSNGFPPDVTLESSTALFTNGDTADRVAGTDTTDDDDALLPDTGGADARLLGLGALMVVGGGYVVARSRRTADVAGR